MQERITLYVDRAGQRWIALDQSGKFWTLPATANPWGDREPFLPAEETELEPVPGHYRTMLGLPSNTSE